MLVTVGEHGAVVHDLVARNCRIRRYAGCSAEPHVFAAYDASGWLTLIHARQRLDPVLCRRCYVDSG